MACVVRIMVSPLASGSGRQHQRPPWYLPMVPAGSPQGKKKCVWEHIFLSFHEIWGNKEKEQSERMDASYA